MLNELLRSTLFNYLGVSPSFEVSQIVHKEEAFYTKDHVRFTRPFYGEYPSSRSLESRAVEHVLSTTDMDKIKISEYFAGDGLKTKHLISELSEDAKKKIKSFSLLDNKPESMNRSWAEEIKQVKHVNQDAFKPTDEKQDLIFICSDNPTITNLSANQIDRLFSAVHASLNRGGMFVSTFCPIEPFRKVYNSEVYYTGSFNFGADQLDAYLVRGFYVHSFSYESIVDYVVLGTHDEFGAFSPAYTFSFYGVGNYAYARDTFDYLAMKNELYISSELPNLSNTGLPVISYMKL